MSPYENPRNLGEVGIYLRDLEKDLRELVQDIQSVKNTLEESSRADRRRQEQLQGLREERKYQFIMMFLSSIISPVVVGMILVVFKGTGA